MDYQRFIERFLQYGLLAVMMAGATVSAQIPSIDNVRFDVEDTAIVIRYDLTVSAARQSPAAPPAAVNDYRIELFLKKENDPEFFYRPIRVTGDIGTVQTAGREKTIVWDSEDEIPGGITDADFYFEIVATPAEQTSSIRSVWLGTGAVLAVTGIITYFVLSSATPEESHGSGSFPPPPGRPK